MICAAGHYHDEEPCVLCEVNRAYRRWKLRNAMLLAAAGLCLATIVAAVLLWA
jgi:hypothetical protein